MCIYPAKICKLDLCLCRPGAAALLRLHLSVVVQPGGVSAPGVSGAAALAAAAPRQLLRELPAAAAHVRPGDPGRTRHAEEDPGAERERGYTQHTVVIEVELLLCLLHRLSKGRGSEILNKIINCTVRL